MDINLENESVIKKINTKCHIYHNIKGVLNMRDIGGYIAKDGRKLATGRFIRSTSLSKIDKRGEDELILMGVDCVIDLRSSMERRDAPDVIENHKHIYFMHVPMLDYISSNFAAGNFADFPKSLSEMYIGLLENAENDFKAVFDIFADGRFGHYLFHCTAGKDRTGVTTMLLLGLAGVDYETIIEDYSYTEALLGPTVISPEAASLPRYLFESEPASMRETLDHVYEKYGGVPEYLKSIGVDSAKQERILKKLF